jgi:molybdopterin biosynthesis enzyme
MAALLEPPQRIARLTSLADGYGCIDRLARPVAPRRVDIAVAAGTTLAADVTVAVACPPAPLALRDGWAVRSEETLDAGGYAPALLGAPPQRVEAGDPMPAGTDAVADGEAVRPRAGGFEALAVLAPGEGVLPAAADTGPGAPVARAGLRLRHTDVAALAALGIAALAVRAPRVRIAPARVDARLGVAAACLADLARAEGAAAEVVRAAQTPFAAAGADLLVVVGGSGTGARDRSVATLARLGRVEFHGLALAPGDTAACGAIADTPVLIVPGRLDAALAVWLTLGRHALARLAGRSEAEPIWPRVLARKLTSGLGLAEMVLLRRDGEAVAPLASGYLSPSALTQAAGYCVVPPESEGFPAGAQIDMRMLP